MARMTQATDDLDPETLLAEFMPKVIAATQLGNSWLARSGRGRIAMAAAEKAGLVEWADGRFFTATDAGLKWRSATARARVLSVRQPFAERIATGRKTVELRSKPTKHRGPLLIVAGAKPWKGIKPVPGWSFGCAICVVDLVDCRPAMPADSGAAAVGGLLEIPDDGWWAWVLEHPRRVEQVPHKGRQGLYFPDADAVRVLAAVGVGP